MAKKKLRADLTLQGETTYECSVVKDYTDTFVIEQELDNADAFIQLSGFSKSIASLTVGNAKALVIKNISNIACELMIETFGFRNDSGGSTEDVQNSVDMNEENSTGEETVRRFISVLLPAGDFYYLNTNRVVEYAPLAHTTLESAANAPIGQISILPSAINSGNEYRDIDVISGSTYAGGAGVLVDDGDTTITSSEITIDDAGWVKVGDKLRMSTEIMRVDGISGNVLTVRRGLDGSDPVAISNNAEIKYAFHNEHLAHDVGKCQSDSAGRFSQSGAYFGYGRTDDAHVDGLVGGAQAIGPFYTEGGYLDWGLSGITANSSTGLVASTVYTITFVIDEFHADGFSDTSTEVAVAFTTDASDLTWGGSSNAVLPKIQAALDEQFYTTGSGLKNKKVTIGINNGDIRVKSHSNHSDTIVGIGNTTGTTPFGVGNFPALSSSVPDLLGAEYGGGTTDDIVYGPASKLADETITDPVSGKSEINTDAYIFDDGNGNLTYKNRVVGKISYETGHCSWTVSELPNAEFKIHGQTHSAHSGGTGTLTGANSLSSIHARSLNRVGNAKVKMVLFG